MSKSDKVKVENGNTVSMHYVGTFEDGVEFDSSHTRNEPISVVVGSGQLIRGLESALVGMEIGDTKTVNVKPADGYGEYNEEAIAELPMDTFPEDIQENLQVGMVLPLVLKENPGQPFPAKAKEIKDESIVFDLNHPLAGKEVNFDVEILGIETDVTEGTTETEV
jgi:FKBP-type peptidyl-prolyl cis-trans isomerase 2